MPFFAPRLRLRALLLLTVGTVLLFSGCSSAWEKENAAFKKGKMRCPRTNFKVSCSYAPDSGLYRDR